MTVDLNKRNKVTVRSHPLARTDADICSGELDVQNRSQPTNSRTDAELTVFWARRQFELRDVEMTWPLGQEGIARNRGP